MSKVQKAIYFYQIALDTEYKYMHNGQQEKASSINNLFNYYFKESNSYTNTYKYKNKDIQLIIKRNCESCIFGIYAYQSTFKNEMARTIDLEGNEIDYNFLLEYFSFFYIDCESNTLAFIQNRHLPQITDFFVEYLKSDFPMLFISITSLPIENLDTRIKAFNNLEFSFELHDNSMPKMLKNAYDIDKGCYENLGHEFKIKVLKDTVISKFFENKHIFKKWRARGKLRIENNENFIEEKKECINILKNTFTRQAKIDIDKLDYKNPNQIQEYLANELFVVLNPQYIQQSRAKESLPKTADNQIKIDLDNNNIGA